MHRIEKVEDDYQNMMELKKRAEDADVAKSQVSNITTQPILIV
jgi:histidine kinase 2/3/4 (cytokinin receptor)